ncbi:MAG: PAS domain S-box protein [Candidatus Sumerlaeia bacterium]
MKPLEELESIISQKRILVCLWKDSAGRPIEYISASREFIGYTDADLVEAQAPYHEIIHPEDRVRVEEALLEARDKPDGPVFLEYRIRTSGGEIKWVEEHSHARLDEKGRVTGFSGMIIDRTHTKDVELALRDSEELHRITLDNISDAVFITDNAHRFTFICPNVHVIFGYEFNEVQEFGNIEGLLGAPIYDAELLDQKGEIANIEKRILDKQGREHYLLVNVKQVSIREGTLLFTCRDITHQRELERELSRITEQERERIGQELHDGICQQLTGVMCLSTALRDSMPEDAGELQSQARDIENLVEETIQQTRALVKGLSPVKREPNGLLYALEDLAASVRKNFGVECLFQHDRGIEFHNHHAATQLYRIVQEALQNAIRHGHASRLEIRLRKEEEQLILEVEDNGSGFDFDKATKGMGLNLMRHRADKINAHFLSVRQASKGGIRVTCALDYSIALSEE